MQTKRAKQQQFNRLKKRIYEAIKYYDALFLTMTFNANILASTNEETRKRYIIDFLQNQCDTYILNKDYGKTKEREHYHAIIRVSASFKRDRQKLIDLQAYKYGKITAEHIKASKEKIQETAEKLATHATKRTTRNSDIIYSRKHKTNKTNKSVQIMQRNKAKQLKRIDAEEQAKEIMQELESIYNYE